MNDARMFARRGSLLVLMSTIILMSSRLTPIGHAHKAVFDIAFYVTLGLGILILIPSFMTRKKPDSKSPLYR